jgi:hypothetical protein
MRRRRGVKYPCHIGVANRAEGSHGDLGLITFQKGPMLDRGAASSTGAFICPFHPRHGVPPLFYIKDGKLIECAPTGRCYTDETVQPESRYLRLRAK